MNIQGKFAKKMMALAIASALLTACTATLPEPEGAVDARTKLTQLQNDAQLASRAPVAINEAELAVRAAEQPTKDTELAQHRVFMADRKVEIARAVAENRLLVDQRKMLSEQREAARLENRTREADRARSDAASARTATASAQMAAEAAGADSAEARQQIDELQQQIAGLNARATDRGLVITLGDLLFDTGKSDLKGGAATKLGGLSAFLNKYPDRTVIIEGHTDNVGSEDSNLLLSQRRADSVKSYLLNQGVAPNRIAASGKGEASPVATNDTAFGRQKNRRVDIIIQTTPKESQRAN